MRRPLPNIEHVARALLVQGAREAAIDLLEAAVMRSGEDRPRCETLLAAVRSRPHDRVSGPPLALDAALVETLAAHGRLVEAWAVTRGASIGNTVAGVEIAGALATVMDTLPAQEPWRSRWSEIVATGNASGIAAIEREVLSGEPVPAALIERLRIAWRLLRGYWTSTANDDDHGVTLPAEARRAIRQRLDGRDLLGALAAVRASVATTPGAAPVAMALARLVAATERLVSEEGPTTASRTIPLEGPGLALLQVRMGNFDEAEKGFRRVVLERSADHVSRDRLTDVLLVRRALSEPSSGGDDEAELAYAKTPSPDWLNKRARKASVEGWASKGKPAKPAGSWDDSDDSTSVIRPDEQAELHVKSGAPEKAVRIYRRLVEKYPEHPRFRARLAEIEAMTPEGASLDSQAADPPATVVAADTTLAGRPTLATSASFAQAAATARAVDVSMDSAALSFDDTTSVDNWHSLPGRLGEGAADRTDTGGNREAVTVRRIVPVR